MKNRRVIHAVLVLLAMVATALPNALSFSLVEKSGDAVSYEKIVTCSYWQVIENGMPALMPMAALVLLGLLLIATVVSLKYQHRLLDVTMTVLSVLSLAAVLVPIAWQGLERFTPTSLTVAFLLVCSLVLSVQHLTGHYFIDPTAEEE